MKFLYSLLFTFNSCAITVVELHVPSSLQRTQVIHVVHHGKHTGIAIKRSEVQESLWPELADFPKAVYLEVSWGAADYYPIQQPTMSLGLQTLLFSSAGTLHVVALMAPPQVSFPAHPVVDVYLSDHGFAQLIEFIHHSYTHNAQGQAIPIGNSIYGQGYFYQAQGQYSVWLNNCNHWTVSALRTAGHPITPFYAMTADNIIYQLRATSKSGQFQDPK